VSRTETVVINCPPGTYTNVIFKALKEIDPKAMDIENIKVKRAVTDGLIYEVAGENRVTKANALAAALKEVLPPKATRVTRPHKTADLRLHGLDDVTVPTEVAEAVAKVGSCTPAEVKMGQLWLTPSGLYSAWVQCPLASANKIAEVDKVWVGWVMARVTLLT
jgi:hypothetical protein